MKRYFTALLPMTVLSVVLPGLSACGGGSAPASSNTQAAKSPASGSVGAGSGSGTGGTAASSGSVFASFMDKDKLLIGAQMEDATAASAPFDARYATWPWRELA